LRDEAKHYGNRLINSSVLTTVRRQPPPPLQAPGARNQCACQVNPLDRKLHRRLGWPGTAAGLTGTVRSNRPSS
jgi:hypothetical protein